MTAVRTHHQPEDSFSRNNNSLKNKASLIFTSVVKNDTDIFVCFGLSSPNYEVEVRLPLTSSYLMPIPLTWGGGEGWSRVPPPPWWLVVLKGRERLHHCDTRDKSKHLFFNTPVCSPVVHFIRIGDIEETKTRPVYKGPVVTKVEASGALPLGVLSVQLADRGVKGMEETF